MLCGEQVDRGARFCVVVKVLQRRGQGGHEGSIGAAQHEPEQRAGLEPGIADAGVFERPLGQLVCEVFAKAGEGCALGARQHDDDGGAVAEAKLQQILGEGVILGSGFAYVFDRAQGADAAARAPRELLHQLGRHGGVEQLLLASEVLVQVAHGRPGPLGDVGHSGGFEAELGEGLGRSGDEALAHVLFENLSHLKENIWFAFRTWQAPGQGSGGRDRGWGGSRRRD
jgi:hypothetical protein